MIKRIEVPERDKGIIERVRKGPVTLLPQDSLLVLQGSEDDSRDGEKDEEEEEEEDKTLGGNSNSFRPIFQGDHCLRHLATKWAYLTKTLPQLCLENIHLALSEIFRVLSAQFLEVYLEKVAKAANEHGI